MSKVDLHLHTTASDGKFTPAEIVRLARVNGLEYIAITDHDSIDGVIPAKEAARSIPGITVISGVEINTDVPSGELHLLGYFIDTSHEELISTLERLRNSRIERARKMVEKLKIMGVEIDYQRVKEIAGEGSVGRPHIAQALMEKGYISIFREAFDKYIGRNGPAYVERDKITPVEATQLILRAGGIPVLAHPFTFENPELYVIELSAAGLKGMEIYYNKYTPDQVNTLLKIAKRYNLIPTGGSDFHGIDTFQDPPLGTVEVPLKCAENLIALARH
jgi:predicted metal-dependent phosphoesterase TrpH